MSDLISRQMALDALCETCAGRRNDCALCPKKNIKEKRKKDMYAKKVKALQWVDHHAAGDQRRNFKALYVFDDGFFSEDECKEKLREIGYDPGVFAMVYFCDQWYAVNMTGYENFVVVSAENIIYKVDYFADRIDTISISGTTPKRIPKVYPFSSDNKPWADGIEKDMRSIDDRILVKLYGNDVTNDAIIGNNVIVTFGREFFRTEICVRTNGYIDRVFRNYYSPRSMIYVFRKIEAVRKSGKEYYNPFTGEMSKNSHEKDRRAKEYLERCWSYEDISDEASDR